MKLKFLFHGLHTLSIRYPAHTVAYILYPETATEEQRKLYGQDIEQNAGLVAYSTSEVEPSMWKLFKLKKL